MKKQVSRRVTCYDFLYSSFTFNMPVRRHLCPKKDNIVYGSLSPRIGQQETLCNIASGDHRTRDKTTA